MELPLEFKKKMIACKACEDFFAFMTKESISNGPEQLYIYIYDLFSSKYLGFINISQIIGVQGIDVG